MPSSVLSASTTSSPPAPAFWARAASDEAAYAREQAALGRLWTVLGLAEDLAEDGQWFRTTLGGRSVFVQRFGDALRGFENKCAHRFYPLRTADRGKGPVVCGFHHWRYNKEGLALGIPVCDAAFGTTPRSLNARLAPLEIDVCGGLVFGRFPSEDHRESLAEFLGDAEPVLKALYPAGMRARRLTGLVGSRDGEIRANWKFLTEIGLDDYHIVAVHPSTFGRGGYLDPATVRYARFGRHSLYTTEPGEDPIAGILRDCRAGSYLPRDYVILNLFPSFGISQFHTVKVLGQSYYFVLAHRYEPCGPGRTKLNTWLLPGPRPAPRAGAAGLADGIAARMIARAVPYYVRRVMSEDAVACEHLQEVAGQIDGPQRLSPAFETRIGWFEEVYEQEVGGLV